MAPFIDGGRTGRPDELVQHVHLLLPVRRRDRAGARPDAARPQRRPRDARRLHAGDVARATASRAAAREGYVDRPYTIADAEATLAEVSGDARVRARVLRALHPGPRGRRLRAAAVARRVHGAQAERRARVARRSPARVARRRASRRWWRRLADLRGRPRSGRRAAADRRPADQQRRATSRPPSRGTSRATPSRSCSSIAPAAARTARVTLAEDPHLEVVPAEHGGTLTAAQKAFRDRWLGAK